MLESSVEARCCAWAKTQGVRPVKLSHGDAGMPDRGFLLPGQRIWIVEFKSPTGRLSKRQKLVREELAAIGHPVEVIRSLAQFKPALEAAFLRALDA